MQRFLGVLTLFVVAILSLQGCSNDHFLKNKKYREAVEADFEARKALLENRADAMLSVLEREGLTTEQSEALKFLFAYMPLCDVAEYDGDYFLEQVDLAFKARDHFEWGRRVPDDVFRHFVLPYRVNNEYLDDGRAVFFDELRERVEGMTMEEAALEVNHWCHEKVTYRATDGRTSSPLALIKTSWGRCGEETVLAALACRAVGIPARQCYTPRWVHTDSNHAWIEVWVDGEWHYMGACEPEPKLDVAWFTGPASRAMMVHTNVFGRYEGPEEVNHQSELYTVINLTHNYAPVRTVGVRVVDEAGVAVEGAEVEFQVYNYARFYPIADVVTDAEGEAQLISAMGDLFVWATKDGLNGYAKSTPEDEVVTVVLGNFEGREFEEIVVMNVPQERPAEPLPKELVEANRELLIYEDSIRNAYMATFANGTDIERVVRKTGLDNKRVGEYMTTAQGNWRGVERFIVDNHQSKYLFGYLDSFREKDLRDTPYEVLQEHFENSLAFGVKEGTPVEMIAKYVISPRIEYELIKPWRTFANETIGVQRAKMAQDDVSLITKFVSDYVEIDQVANYINCMLTPRGVYELRVADRRSRNIFFVALCRSCGIPARVEIATAKPQYYENGNWIDVDFEQPEEKSLSPKGQLTISNSPSNPVTPGYGPHYTLAIYKNGYFQTLDYSAELTNYPAQITVDAGYYRLTIGSRANDGSVTADVRYFNLAPNQQKAFEIELPKVEGKMVVMGIVDMNSEVVQLSGEKSSLKELSQGKGVILCFGEPGREPSVHILQDLPRQSAAIDEWGGAVVFMIPEKKMTTAFDPATFKELPERSTWHLDGGSALLAQAAGALKVDAGDNLPFVLYLNDNGGILYYSLGYRIGIGENLVRTFKEEKNLIDK